MDRPSKRKARRDCGSRSRADTFGALLEQSNQRTRQVKCFKRFSNRRSRSVHCSFRSFGTIWALRKRSCVEDAGDVPPYADANVDRPRRSYRETSTNEATCVRHVSHKTPLAKSCTHSAIRQRRRNLRDQASTFVAAPQSLKLVKVSTTVVRSADGHLDLPLRQLRVVKCHPSCRLWSFDFFAAYLSGM